MDEVHKGKGRWCSIIRLYSQTWGAEQTLIDTFYYSLLLYHSKRSRRRCQGFFGQKTVFTFAVLRMIAQGQDNIRVVSLTRDPTEPIMQTRLHWKTIQNSYTVSHVLVMWPLSLGATLAQSFGGGFKRAPATLQQQQQQQLYMSVFKVES